MKSGKKNGERTVESSERLVICDLLISSAVDRKDVTSGQKRLDEEVAVLAAQVSPETRTEVLIGTHPKLHGVHDNASTGTDSLEMVTHNTVTVCNGGTSVVKSKWISRTRVVCGKRAVRVVGRWDERVRGVKPKSKTGDHSLADVWPVKLAIKEGKRTEIDGENLLLASLKNKRLSEAYSGVLALDLEISSNTSRGDKLTEGVKSKLSARDLSRDGVKSTDLVLGSKSKTRAFTGSVKPHDISSGVDILGVNGTVALKIATVNHVLRVTAIPQNLDAVHHRPEVVPYPGNVGRVLDTELEERAMDDISVDGGDGKVNLRRRLEDILLVGSGEDLDVLGGSELSSRSASCGMNIASMVRHAHKVLSRTSIDVDVAVESRIVTEMTLVTLSGSFLAFALANLSQSSCACHDVLRALKSVMEISGLRGW